jgi:hypothetical protein
VSAFGVTVALSGLRPALAMYYNESGDVKTRPILDVIAKIIVEDGEYAVLKDATAKGLVKHTLPDDPAEELKKKPTAKELVKHALNVDDKYLKTCVLEAAIALKQVIRTYELKD